MEVEGRRHAFVTAAHQVAVGFRCRFPLDVKDRNGYDSAVRRLSAILLLGLFVLSVFAPALIADPESKLPACCRRGGEHHCAITPLQSAAGPVVQSLCPFFPDLSTVPTFSKVTGVRPTQLVLGQAVSHPRGSVQARALFRISFSRTRQKRGPPTNSLS